MYFIERDIAFAAFVGGTSSGKSTIADIIRDTIHLFADVEDPQNLVTVVHSDIFYRDIDEVNLIQDQRIWDDPNLINYQVTVDTLKRLSQGEDVTLPFYRKRGGKLIFKDAEKDPEDTFETPITLRARPIILVEGFLLHAVRQATGTYLKSGIAPTHQSKNRTDTVQFYEGVEVVPTDKRDEFYKYMFGENGEDENGLFGEHKYFVDCNQEEALIRRLIRDCTVHSRGFQETIEMWPEARRTYFDTVEREAQGWSNNIDNTTFNKRNAAQLYHIALSLIEQAGIQVNPKYTGTNREEGINEIYQISQKYLDSCVLDYQTRGGEGLQEFVQQYEANKQEVNRQLMTYHSDSDRVVPIYDLLPKKLPFWLTSRL